MFFFPQLGYYFDTRNHPCDNELLVFLGKPTIDFNFQKVPPNFQAQASFI
jgi:hypothetical protein